MLPPAAFHRQSPATAQARRTLPQRGRRFAQLHGKAQLPIAAKLCILYVQHHLVGLGLLRVHRLSKIQHRRYAGILARQQLLPFGQRMLGKLQRQLLL